MSSVLMTGMIQKYHKAQVNIHIKRSLSVPKVNLLPLCKMVLTTLITQQAFPVKKIIPKIRLGDEKDLQNKIVRRPMQRKIVFN